MKFALVDEQRLEAKPNLKGFCVGCGGPMTAKCGEVRLKHWAHQGRKRCDPWWEPETEWHRAWKNQFPSDWQEFVQRAGNGEKHIADVKTKADWVLEFQHSFINPEERKSREDFYKKMMWVVDADRSPQYKNRFLKALKDDGFTNRQHPEITAIASKLSNTVSFAYRFAPDRTEFTLFDKDIGWSKFRESIKATAPNFQFVLRCDISDFYPRIYHHRLENALQRAVKNTDLAKRITKLVSEIAGGPSYGLPVGGNAARLLSELLLNQVDRLLATEGVKFYRFVDDYVIFANTREEAQSALISLTKFLLTNEGLSLQKSKTKIMSSAEFLLSSDLVDEVEGNSPEAEKERAFRKLRIHYDPYAQTAKEDYEALANELTKYDIVGMLGRELTKSRVDEGLTKRLITAVTRWNRNGPSLNVSHLVISKVECIALLQRLERIGFVEMQPKNQYRLLVAKDFTWIVDGPIMRLVKGVSDDFFNHGFEAPGEILKIINVRVSPAMRETLKTKLEQVALQYADQVVADSHLSLDERPYETYSAGKTQHIRAIATCMRFKNYVWQDSCDNLISDSLMD